MNKEAIVMCVHASSGELCRFDKCPLLDKCFPEFAKELEDSKCVKR
jgi:hypothetical protein